MLKSETPVLVTWTVFGKRIFAHVLKSRQYSTGLGVGPKHNDWCHYMLREIWAQTQRRMPRDGSTEHVMAQAETRATFLQAKDTKDNQHPPEARRKVQKGFDLSASRRNQLC